MTPTSKARVAELIKQMTVIEKIGQLNQLCGPPLADLSLVRAGRVGSLVIAAGPVPVGSDKNQPISPSNLNELQRIAVEESHLKIPLLFARDVVHGFRTVFPIPLGLAATWSPDLVKAASVVAAQEARSQGVRWVYAPVLDVSRDPRWGRVSEGWGEDPFLTAAFARASIEGLQGDDLAHRGVAACAKHFAGYGAVEGGRDYASADLSLTSLRSVHFPPFRAAIEAGVKTVMSAFIDLNGIPATANEWLLNQILREEWRFEGVVVSDWNAIAELGPAGHAIARSLSEAAALALNSGLDVDMFSGAYDNHLAELVSRDPLLAEDLDRAVQRVLLLKHDLGLFESPYVEQEIQVTPTPASRALARRVAGDSIVLLQNREQLLPLKRDLNRIVVLGPLARSRETLLGTWSPDGRPSDVVTIVEGIAAAVGSTCEVYSPAEGDTSIPRYELEGADVIIAVIGEHPMRTGEGASVANLALPPGDEEFVSLLQESGRPLIVIVLAGRPLILTKIARAADAILYAWHPGIEGGTAIADILFGAISPSAKLPMTFPRSAGQIPIYYSQKSSGRPRSNVPQRGACQYIDVDTTPLYPFGFGLSYTTFHYSDLVVQVTEATKDEEKTISISTSITNTGNFEAREIAQLYLRHSFASRTRPIKELKGFAEITLSPGQQERVSWTLALDSLEFFDGEKFRIESGRYEVFVGTSSEKGVSATFEL